MIAWIDLEATGLDAAKHVILEVAAIVTDDQLLEIDRFHRVVRWVPARMLALLGPDSSEAEIKSVAAVLKIDRVVIDLHTKGGLWAEAAQSEHALADVDTQLAVFLSKTSVEPDGQKAQIAGSSIWLDRSFMSVHMPLALRQLHYRCIDVTTLNELARRCWPRLHQGRPAKREVHRAMPDIEDSLDLCRYYAAQIGALDVTS